MWVLTQDPQLKDEITGQMNLGQALPLFGSI